MIKSYLNVLREFTLKKLRCKTFVNIHSIHKRVIVFSKGVKYHLFLKEGDITHFLDGLGILIQPISDVRSKTQDKM